MTQNTYFDSILKELTEIHQERSYSTRQENPVNTFITNASLGLRSFFSWVIRMLYKRDHIFVNARLLLNLCILNIIHVSSKLLTSLPFRTGVNSTEPSRAIARNTNDIWYKNTNPVFQSWAFLRKVEMVSLMWPHT